eukprot:g1530.t1
MSTKTEMENDIDTKGLAQIFSGYDKSIRPALDAVDEIRPYVKDIPEISAMLPALVVVGEQSAGKSSLLESISGIALPRGHGMCTKVPLELQLRKDQKESITMDYTDSSGKAVNKPNISFQDISDEIEKATVDIAGTGKCIKDQPISLRICGSTMKDLTLIDLPGKGHTIFTSIAFNCVCNYIGITRAANSPQEANVELETTGMIKKYVKSESKVIVCALPASVDFSNSGALKIAQDLDVDGKRTQGVVTKIDTYAKGTGIKDKIEGTHDSEIKLRLGYVAVRCRTQLELDAGMSLEELHAIEQELLTTDEELKHIRKDLKGTPVLIDRLIDIQRNRLIEKVPDLIKKIEGAIVERNQELEGLKSLPETKEDCFLQLIMAANTVCARFKEISSRNTTQNNDLAIKHKIYVRLKEFKEDIEAASSNVFNDDIMATVKSFCLQNQSNALPNFLSSLVFVEICKNEFLDEYIEPTEFLILDVHRLTRDVLSAIVSQSIGIKLKGAIPAFEDMIDEYLESVKEDVLKSAKQETAMNSEIFAPLTTTYEQHLKRLNRFQEAFVKYSHDPPKNSRGHVIDFSFAESELLCCTYEEQDWIKTAAVRAVNDSLNSHCLSMMNSIAAYLRNVCECTLEHSSKKMYRMFLTKPMEDGPEGLQDSLIEKCKEQKEDLFNIIYDPNLIYQRDRLKREVAALEKSKEALRRSVRISTKTEMENDIDTKGLAQIFSGYDKSIRPTLDTVNEIRPYVKDIPGISAMLPPLVVVGEQSAGKSSLLEFISGIALPRGHGMCTKVPLELQLRKDQKESITMDYTDSSGKAMKKSDISFQDTSDEIEMQRRLQDQDLFDLVIKSLLGKGACCSVYHCHWRGTFIALKIIDHSEELVQAGNTSLEALVSKNIAHLNMVQTFLVKTLPYGQLFVKGLESSISASPVEGSESEDEFKTMVHSPLSAATHQTFILMEYCNRESLDKEIQKGSLKKGVHGMQFLILTALDIANAISYLHSLGVTHGDLKAANVLLKTDTTDPRGFICKISDFGRDFYIALRQGYDTAFKHGTVTHMSPEMLTEGKLSHAVDVYSFGMLLWEMIAMEDSFPIKTQSEVMLAIANGHRPRIPHNCPPGYSNLISCCWRHDYEQ